MASDARLMTSVVMEKCKWVFNGLESLVDVGGGTGTMAKAIAKSFPKMECIVFDLPHVVAGLEGSENLKYVAGNMFNQILLQLMPFC
ncbi:S-adenosyl-L-methionine-dependent methyltransferase [Sesbania bispinosa]|nr:S-adenosyl-L-methionine-dependent methyltransferase [Sesbania bispinosa]